MNPTTPAHPPQPTLCRFCQLPFPSDHTSRDLCITALKRHHSQYQARLNRLLADKTRLNPAETIRLRQEIQLP